MLSHIEKLRAFTWCLDTARFTKESLSRFKYTEVRSILNTLACFLFSLYVPNFTQDKGQQYWLRAETVQAAE